MIPNVKDWLSKQGYPTEMAVAQSLVQQQFDVITSEYYVDPNTEKMREIDVVATRAKYVDQNALWITWVIECKSAKKHPWVLFSPTELVIEPEEQLTARPTSALANDVFRHLNKATVKKNAYEIFMPPAPLGSNLVPSHSKSQAENNNADAAYAALCSCVTAANYRIQRANESLNSFASNAMIGEITFPTIVIDGKLIHAYLTDKGELELAEIESGTVVWRNQEFGIPRTLVNIYTLSHFKNKVLELKNHADQFLDKAYPQISHAIESWQLRELGQFNVNV